MSTSFDIAVPIGFRLSNAVCSYGFFIQAPNVWDPQNGDFQRPLTGNSAAQFQVNITQDTDEEENILQVHTTADATQDDFEVIEAQVRRMLRLNEADQLCIGKFQSMNKTAKKEGFGALFRSPTVWEDLIKSMLLCNCGWGRTLQMNKALCREVGGGAFPTPENIVEASLTTLQASCGLGYRAKSILNLAHEVISGDVDLEGLDKSQLSEQDLFDLLIDLPGVGPFTAANMMTLLGHYRRVPCDSETVRHLQKAHGLQRCTQATVQADVDQVYGHFAPFQFLAYWHELWRDYEALVGPFEQLSPERYHLLTGHSMRKAERFRSQTALNGVVLESASMDPVPLAPAAVQTRSRLRSAAQERAQTPNVLVPSATQELEQSSETMSAAQVEAQTEAQTDAQMQRSLAPSQQAVTPKPSLMNIKIETAAQFSQDAKAGAAGQQQAQTESKAQPHMQLPTSPFASPAEQALTGSAQQVRSDGNVASAAHEASPELVEAQKLQLASPGADAETVRGSSGTPAPEKTASTPKSAKKRGRSKASQQHSRKHSRASAH